MADRREIAVVYAAAVIQGMVLVTFPAVSAILSSQEHYGLSTTAYGGLFLPQAAAAILSSILGAALTRLVGEKRVFLIGLGADLMSMVLLFASQFAIANHALAYGTLLAATACLGVGFGFAVPSVNTFTAAFFPGKVDRAVLILNALLGLGTALAPVLAIVFSKLGFWWGLPVLMIVLTLALLLVTLPLPLHERAPRIQPVADDQIRHSALKIPSRFWIYAAFAAVYGICETMSANWGPVFLSSGLGASAFLASMALTVFWMAVTGGRVLFAVIDQWCPQRWTYRALPIVLVLAFLALAAAPPTHPSLVILFFGVAGLGCSALLPLVISFGQKELATMTTSVAGGLIGFYQMGYGLAAFGVGPLQTWTGSTLASLYGWTSLFAYALVILAMWSSRPQKKGSGS